MQKIVLVHDDNHVSNIYNNSIDFLSRQNKIGPLTANNKVYSIKLMTSSEANRLKNNNNFLLTAKEIGTADFISLVSFGGVIYHIDIQKMIEIADKTQSAILAAIPNGNTSEAEILLNTFITDRIENNSNYVFIYGTLNKIANSNVYYFAINPSLVQAVGNIEIKYKNIFVDHIKGHIESLRDFLFSPSFNCKKVDNTLLYESPISIKYCTTKYFEDDNLDDSFFKTLNFKIDTKNCEAILNQSDKELIITKRTDNPGYISIEILPPLFDNKIKSSEKLKWEYLILDV